MSRNKATTLLIALALLLAAGAAQGASYGSVRLLDPHPRVAAPAAYLPFYVGREAHVRLEVLDNDGKPCRPGTFGRVVMTTLQNYASPLIRYEIGDYAEVGEDCSCGRTLPVLKRILGRHRNLCVLKNGERFFPEIRPELTSFRHILQFQVHQRSLEDIDFSVVVRRPFTQEEKDELQAIVQNKFHYPFNVRVIEVDDIPREANGKFEEFKSDLAEARIDS